MNELHQQLDFIRWALEEAQDAADLSQRRTAQAVEAMSELLDEGGPVFMRVRCQTCRSSWLDERKAPTVTACPSCGKKIE
jgi:ribosomal protein S27E